MILWLAGAAIKIVQEYERGVIFRLGRLVGARGPGLFLIIPFVDRMVKVDLRVVTLDVPAQEVITQGQCDGEGERGALLQGVRPGEGGRGGH